METYHVSGTLIKENFIAICNDERHFHYRHISQELEASGKKAAISYLETDGWKFEREPEVVLIGEAKKMERAGQPTLFEAMIDR